MSTSTEVVSHQAHHHVEEIGFYGRRSTAKDGVWGWLTTIDHKKIAVLYGVTSLLFFVLGGIEALGMRTQLAKPDLHLMSGDFFNQLVTMHATTMIFLAVMPLSAAFFNLLVPLMIGARDVAFPRMNAFSFWVFLAGGIILNVSWFTGGATNAGWFGYANLTSSTYSAGHGVDYWIMGLLILGTASIAASLNFFVTIINMRAPGMSMMKLPVFVWMTLVTNVLILLAFPAITIVLVQLMMDRMFDTTFFNVAKGGMVIMWQHWFWVFGHPEVYILILPAMGIVSEILPTFSRKSLFGYPLIVFSGAFIGFMGFAVWSHHMYTTGMGYYATLAFSITTSIIAVPTGVKIFNWLFTLWGGKLHFKTPMLYAVGFIGLFMIGGFSGLMHSAAAADAQQQDTYFIVAHFHYVLIGGSIFALFAGCTYWYPKVTGRLMDEGLGKLAFWTIFVGFNVTFFPMHFLGLNGMPRRIYMYSDGMGWNFWNLVCTIGAFILAFGVLLFAINIIRSATKGEVASGDPWDARTLEWSISSPPPEYNFAVTPEVVHRDDWWHIKQSKRELPPVSEKTSIHLPGPSVYPLMAAIGLFIFSMGMIYKDNIYAILIAIGGLLFMMFNVIGWAVEGPGGEHVHPDPANHTEVGY